MSLAYFDSSALLPLVVSEPATARCMIVWDASDAIVSSSLSYVEVHAALAQAERTGRLTRTAHTAAMQAFAARWDAVVKVTPGDAVLQTAAALASERALRAYDAVQCATALAAASADLVAIAGDRSLLRAWGELGVPTIDAGG